MTLHAVWKPIHTITFVTKIGTVEPVPVIDGEFLALPVVKDTEEASFIGWYIDEDFIIPFDSNIPIHKDTTLRAKWTCEVTLNLDDAVDQSEKPSYLKSIIVTKDSNLGILPVPIREGYRFISWIDDKGESVSSDKIISSNIELKATWIQVFTVMFRTKEGNFLDSQEVEENGNAECEYSYCTDPSFIGWYEDSAYLKLFQLTTEITKDVTLYGKWEYTITFNVNGVTITNSIESLRTITSGSQIGSLPSPKSNNLIFDSWNTEQDGSG